MAQLSWKTKHFAQLGILFIYAVNPVPPNPLEQLYPLGRTILDGW